MQSKSLYRSRTGGDFDGTENEIWAGFTPVGSAEKNNWGQLLSVFFHVFSDKK